MMQPGLKLDASFVMLVLKETTDSEVAGRKWKEQVRLTGAAEALGGGEGGGEGGGQGSQTSRGRRTVVRDFKKPDLGAVQRTKGEA